MLAADYKFGVGAIRFLLAASVVAGHAQPYFGVLRLVGGDLAVQAFFIVSGFYMDMVIGKYHTAFSFYASRLFRLYPTYLACAVCIFLTSLPVFYGGIFTGLDVGNQLFVVVSNCTMLFQDLFLFLGSKGDTFYFIKQFWESPVQVWALLVIPQAWSLSLEIYFYLLAPFLLRKSFSAVLIVFLMSASVRLVVYVAGLPFDPWNYRFFPSSIMFFLAGALVRRIHLKTEGRYDGRGKYLTIAIILLTILYLDVFSFISKYIYLLLFSLSLPFIFQYSKNSRFDRHVGELSYGIYLIHYGVIEFLNKYSILTRESPFFGIVVLTASALFALLFTIVIQRNIDTYRKRFSKI